MSHHWAPLSVSDWPGQTTVKASETPFDYLTCITAEKNRLFLTLSLLRGIVL